MRPIYKIFIITLFMLVGIYSVIAINYQTVYNPFTSKLDYTWDGNETALGNGHLHNASNITSGTFGAGNFVFQNNITADTGFFNLNWSYITNKFITAVSGAYLYMSGSTLNFNDTLLNATFQKEIGVNCTAPNFVVGVYDNGTLVCDAPAGSGDITAVYTGDNLLLGGGASGDINLTFNTTALINNIGNWSADKPSYATTVYANSLGNFSAWSGVVNAVNISAGVYPAGNFRYQGNVNMTNNNVTSVDCIIFKDGGQICSSA